MTDDGPTLGDRVGQLAATPAARKRELQRLADAFRDAGLDPADLGAVREVKFYEQAQKDADGDARVVPMVSVTVDPAWRTGPAWPVVQPAAPTRVTYGRTRPPVVRDGWHRAVILPDPQVGYRALNSRATDDGQLVAELDPFHDDAALDVAVDIVRAVRPSVVVNLGDFLDFPEFGTYEQQPEWALTGNAAVNAAHRFLARQRAAAGPDAELVLLEGNHDRRLPKAVARNAMAALRLRRAGDPPDGWPVLSVPHLLRLDDLAVTYVDGYPAAAWWLNDQLACIHGHKVSSTGSTAWRVIADEVVSVLMGHVHRLELVHRRPARTRDHPEFSILAASPGCLSRTDGAVPSAKGSTDALGRPVSSAENWQQGVAVVTYQPDPPHRYYVELVPIHGPGDGSSAWCMYRDRLYESTREQPAA